MNVIYSSVTIYDLLTLYPELKDALYELGFTDIVKPGMISTVGRIMTLSKGSKLKKIAMNDIALKLETYGFELKED
ncbi:DUF1858 domain-containing protein [Fusibacter bizertensis]|uniref:DUF1858 domain-containing protein n=1 Tax=Fusibacter bizertensis TaxID=1488331 RepID=A0ABT6NHC9_9FIRM|nr:DUF1858 domain-containing protein [Fusibacter bizertensis]MDH8679750.1 DUF1858 domain-containing protein [Fusibacter bizertensis]